jgi:hypothetical protein
LLLGFMNPIQASRNPISSCMKAVVQSRHSPSGAAIPLAQPSPAFLPDDEDGYYAAPEEEAEEEPKKIDWGTWLLGLLAFASLFGLIPFWLYVYMNLRP